MIIAKFQGAGSSPEKDFSSDADSDIVEVEKDQDDLLGYAYVGSHNFTPSAWGTLSGSGFTPILNASVCYFRRGFQLLIRLTMAGDKL
jgi:tyrosyl-DNA phosphodiesterase-1